MSRRFARASALGVAVLFAALAAAAAGPSAPRPLREPDATRLIVGLRPDGATPAAAAERVRLAATRAGVRLRAERAIAPRLRVLELETPLSGADVEETVARLAGDPAVAFAEPDRRVFRHAVAADPLFPNQWYLQAEQASAIDAVGAWDLTTGSPGTVVAVLDTGVRFEHPDLGRAGQGGRLLPGRDFVGPDAGGGFRVANDGDGWDDDPSDPGDWVSGEDTQLALFADCLVEDSTWHGTRVAGMIGAVSNNGTGIAGATWKPWLLPVRVLGKCFGYTSDILQGMRWAAGLTVAGVPDNPFPAKILNMSLGAPGACSAGYRSVVEELAGQGVLVVASAGNSAGGPLEYPANCPGVLAVAGLRHVGTKVGFSSIGPEVAVSAPGGNCVNIAAGAPCLFSLDTTYDVGSTAPVASSYTDQFNVNVGTSFAAPPVAAIAALVHAVNGNLDAAALRSRIREGARAFPPPSTGIPLCRVPLDELDIQLECACTTDTCGAGMANAPGAVQAAMRPIAAVRAPATVAPGQNVVLDASGSAAACGRSISTFRWTPVSGTPLITAPDAALTSVIAPVLGSVTVRLTVTDERGAQDVADVTVSASAASTAAPASAGDGACPAPIDPSAVPAPEPTPPPAGAGGGGGGRTGAELLLLLVLAFWRKSGGTHSRS